MDTSGILGLLQETAEEVITPKFRELADHEIDTKDGPSDFVTVADRAAEKYLAERLRLIFPDALVVGEESIFEQPGLRDLIDTADHALIIDPIDGTRNFVTGSTNHGMILAESRSGITTRGWIWQPETGHSYVAERGAGVERDGHALRREPSNRPPLGATSRRSLHGWTGDGALSPTVATHYACCFDYPALLDGEIDFVHYLTAKPWDHLAGSLMVRELGGVSRTLAGQDYAISYRGEGLLVADSPETWDLVRGLWPDKR